MENEVVGHEAAIQEEQDDFVIMEIDREDVENGEAAIQEEFAVVEHIDDLESDAIITGIEKNRVLMRGRIINMEGENDVEDNDNIQRNIDKKRMKKQIRCESADLF